MKMIDRIASAVEPYAHDPYGWGDLDRKIAIRALEAMKRPVTDAMIDAGTNAQINGQNVSEIFEAMVNAALNDGGSLDDDD